MRNNRLHCREYRNAAPKVVRSKHCHTCASIWQRSVQCSLACGDPSTHLHLHSSRYLGLSVCKSCGQVPFTTRNFHIRHASNYAPPTLYCRSRHRQSICFYVTHTTSTRPTMWSCYWTTLSITWTSMCSREFTNYCNTAR